MYGYGASFQKYLNMLKHKNHHKHGKDNGDHDD